MKLNTILVGITMTLLLLASPVAASDYTLGIFGNANEDDTINMQDVTYTELIILEYRDRTELADAKYDGEIDILDMTQIALIILGRDKELTFVDAIGDAVTVNKPVTRIVTLPPSSLESVRTVGAKDKVVGVSTYLNEMFFPELCKLPSVGSSWFTPDYEAILELKPDVVLTLTKYNSGMEDKLGPAGITIVRLEFNDPMTMSKELKKLGYILDTKNQAEEYCDWYEGYMDTIKGITEDLSEEKMPRVYVATSRCDIPDKAAGKGDHKDKICTVAGGINIAGDLVGTPNVDPEWVIVQNPAIIVLAVPSMLPADVSQGYDEDDPTEMKEFREEVMSRTGWENIVAVKTGNVYLLGWQTQLGPSAIVSVAYMAKWFHPELFDDLDPQAIHQEYLTEFQGLDYDLDEHGVFVYPPVRGELI
jgi:iron complex transport system substrate-binding protein